MLEKLFIGVTTLILVMFLGVGIVGYMYNFVSSVITIGFMAASAIWYVWYMYMGLYDGEEIEYDKERF